MSRHPSPIRRARLSGRALWPARLLTLAAVCTSGCAVLPEMAAQDAMQRCEQQAMQHDAQDCKRRIREPWREAQRQQDAQQRRGLPDEAQIGQRLRAPGAAASVPP